MKMKQKVMLFFAGITLALGLIVIPSFQKTITTHAEVTTSTLRIWVDRSNWENDGAVVKLNYYSTDLVTNVEVEPSYAENTALTKWYAYYDVPTSIIGLNYKFKRYQPISPFALWNTSTAYIFSEGDNNQMWFIWDNWSGTITKGSVNSVAVAFVKYVFEGYMTCSSSVSNGYEAFPSIRDTYIKNGEAWRTVGDMGTVTVNDYNSISDYATGKGSTPATPTAWQKYEAMRIRYEAAHAPEVGHIALFNTENIALIWILLISVLAISVLGGYFVLSKKN